MDMEATTLRATLFHAGVTPESFARFARVTLRTVHTWRASMSPPGYAIALADVAAGWLPYDGFEGFRIYRGQLWLPNRPEGLAPVELLRAPELMRYTEVLERDAGQPRQYCTCPLFSGSG
mgnify:CR=1 FL=1